MTESAAERYIRDLDEASRRILHEDGQHTEPNTPECATCIREDEAFRISESEKRALDGNR